jgi:YbbR domain-containing protein
MAVNQLGRGSQDSMKRLVKMLKHDPWRKLFAICCAILVYYVISNKGIHNARSVDVPVEFIMPQGYVSMMPPNTTVNVTFSGNSSFLRESGQMNRLRMVVEIPELGAANFPEYRVTCGKEQLRGLPVFGVQVREFRPVALSVKLDKLAAGEVPVIADYNVENGLSPEYTVTGTTIVPDRIHISGPESIVRNVKNVSTEKIPLTNVTESFEYETRLRPIEFIQTDRNHVRVKMEIGKKYESRIMKSVAVRILKAPGAQDNFKLELLTPHVDVTLRGPRPRLSSLKNTSIRPYIDISMLNESGIYTAQVYCWQDDDSFTVEKIYPPTIQIKLTRPKTN